MWGERGGGGESVRYGREWGRGEKVTMCERPH